MQNDMYEESTNSGTTGCNCGNTTHETYAEDTSNNAAATSTESSDEIEDGFDLLTHGGGSVEMVPGFSLNQPMVQSIGTTKAEPLPTGYQQMIDAGAAHFEVEGPRESVCGRDDRVRIQTASSPPWRMIAKLFITAGNGRSYVGTGWFISPRTLMTAGHCVYSKRSGGWARSIDVVPGMDERVRPYGTATSTEFRSVRPWTDDEDVAHDYACIVLPKTERLGEKTGWFGFANYSDTTLKNLLVNTSGYPADKSPGTQWFNAGRLTHIRPNRLEYLIDTFGGQSGSPVWRYDAVSRKRHVVGVHNYGGCDNKASRITSGLHARMKAWKTLGD